MCNKTTATKETSIGGYISSDYCTCDVCPHCGKPKRHKRYYTYSNYPYGVTTIPDYKCKGGN